jgi:hypothetical protein
LSLLATFALALPATAATLHVPADYPTIQSCIDAAISGQDECVVAPGTYNELINFLGKAITLRSSHGPAVTTIDGTGLNGSVVTCASGETPETVLEGFTITGGTGTQPPGRNDLLGGGMYNADSDPAVTNCIFSNNTAWNGGGGMFNKGSSPTATNCTFANNTAFYGGGMATSGGAPRVVDSAFVGNTASGGGGGMHSEGNLIVANCTFIGNTAEAGGAMITSSHSSSTLIVVDSLFIGNKATRGGGGGMNNYSFGGSQLINRCTFIGNTGSSGGGMLVQGNSQTVTDCMFSDNHADYGGGIVNLGGNPLISNCYFRDNQAGWGGGMYDSGGTPEIRDCVFFENTADAGGGMFNGIASNTILDKCTFTRNRAVGGYGYGGGVYFSNAPDPDGESHPIILSCMFNGNEAEGFGGGLHVEWQTYATISGCTFVGNQAWSGGGFMNHFLAGSTVHDCIFWENVPSGAVNDQATLSIDYSNLQTTYPGQGNFHADPLFINPAGNDSAPGTMDDDFRLKPGSPCINAGDPYYVPQPGENDLDGHARVLCDRVDMGAYEFGIGDFDCNQTVNLADLSAWPDCMTAPTASQPTIENSMLSEPGARATGGLPLPLGEGWGEGQSPIENRQSTIGCESFDFNADGDIDLADLAQFLLLAGVP